MNHRNSVAHLAITPMITPLTPTFKLDSHATSDAFHVVWLRQGEVSSSQVQPVLTALSKAGIHVWLMTTKDVPLEQLLFFDLIIVDALGQKLLDISRTISHIRLGSHAPMLILSDSKDIKWRIHAFRAGADAIVPVSTTPQVFLARCQAMLRRWHSGT